MEHMKIPLKMCRSGEILSKDVIADNGIVLAAKDTRINDFIREKLINWGQSEVNIYDRSNSLRLTNDGLNKGIKVCYTDAIASLKDIIGKLAAEKNVDYDEILSLSEILLTNINESNDIINYLNQVKLHDNYTYTHCLNTAFYCMLISKWMKMTESETRLSIQAGILHDIGKIDIPKEILNKKGILTKDEFEMIKKHTSFGYNRINKFGSSKLVKEDVKEAVLMHHERIDGSGYPFQIKSDSINIYSKIVSVADVFDAMTSDRIYKKRTSPFEAFKMFKTIGINMFDTDIVSTFIKNISIYFTDVDVLLSDGRIGQVVYVPPQDVECPIVKVEAQYLDMSKVDLKLLCVV